MSEESLVIIGQVLKPFGIKGEVKIKVFTESFEAFQNSSVLIFDEKPYQVKKIRAHKSSLLIALEDIDTPEQADLLSGSLVKTDHKNLPDKEEDEYYWFELIGMRVWTVDNRDLGEITRITPTGANDVIHVQGSYGEVLLPMIEDVVLEVDIQEKKMIVDPLEGLITDA